MNFLELLRRIRRERYVRYPRISVYRSRTYFGVSKAMVAIIGTKACWRYEAAGGCTMCPYPQRKPKRIDVERDLELVLRKAEIEKPEALMLYSSGSVLDEREIPFKLLRKFLERLPESIREVYLETRPEFVDERLGEIDRAAFPAIGLETVNDVVRLYHIRKGFTFREFLKAVEKARKYATGVKAYVLLKPPMMLEEEAEWDTRETLKALNEIDGVKVVSVNPVHAEPGTLQYELLKRNLWKPPSMCTLIRILKDFLGRTKYVLISEPLKVGKPEGPRICVGRQELDLLKKAVFDQDPRRLNQIGLPEEKYGRISRETIRRARFCP